MGLPVVDPQAPPSLLKRIITPIALTKAGTWFLKHVSKRVDPWLLKMSRGRVSTVAFTPVVLLTCRGARSGLKRTVPLLYFTDGDRAVLMASNYGGSRHPAWYHNVLANPEVTLTAGGSSGRFIGHETTGEERDRLWRLAQQLTRGYTQYESTTQGRTIPVIAFVPLDDEDARSSLASSTSAHAA